jgi:hypothetical protein
MWAAECVGSTLNVWYGGSHLKGVNGLTPDDLIEIKVPDTTTVEMYHKGDLVHTWNQAPQFPLVADISAHKVGYAITDGTFTSGAVQTVAPPTNGGSTIKWVFDNDYTQTGSTLTRSGNDNNWAGATSEQQFSESDLPLTMAFKCHQNNNDNVHIGLSTPNTEENWPSVMWAAECVGSTLNVWYGGSHLKGVNGLTPDDLIEIKVPDTTRVEMYHKGDLVHTWNQAPQFPLVADVSAHKVGYAITDGTFTSGAIQQNFGLPTAIKWVFDNDYTQVGSTLTRSGNDNNWAGATSEQQFSESQLPLTMAFKCHQNNNDNVHIGLSTPNTEENWPSVMWAAECVGSTLNVWYGGSHLKGVNGLTPDDLIEIKVPDTTRVEMYHKGDLVHTWNQAPQFPLVADVSAHKVGYAITDGTFTSGEALQHSVELPTPIKWVFDNDYTQVGTTLTRSGNDNNWAGATSEHQFSEPVAVDNVLQMSSEQQRQRPHWLVHTEH